MGLPDLYRNLDVEPDASPEAIQAAWKRACFRWHPDSAGKASDPRRLQAAREAYHVLADPEARARYDRSRADRESRPDPPILSAENIRGNYEFLTRGIRNLSRALWSRWFGS